jgi:hypothetical protein
VSQKRLSRLFLFERPAVFSRRFSQPTSDHDRSTPSRGAGRVLAATVAGFTLIGGLSLAPGASAQQKKPKSTTTTVAASTSSSLPPLDCAQKRQILARYERQKARALTNAARADARSKQASATGKEDLAEALQGVIDEQEQRIDVIQAAIDAVKARCS